MKRQKTEDTTAVIQRLYDRVSDLSLRYGMWMFRTYTWIVAAGCFLFYPPGIATSLRFYRVLFPQSSLFPLLRCVWKQYQNFTTIFLDRLRLEQSGEIRHTYSGWEHIASAARKQTGGVILMSHVGNWEMAAHIMKQKNPITPLLLYMGIRQKEQMEKIQKRRLAGIGVEVIGVENGALSPFELIEAIDFIKRGGMVSVTGDRLGRHGQRTVGVPFLGHRIDLPKTPYIFAILSNAPIFCFFAFRNDDGSYRFSSSPPIYVRAASRAAREKAIEKAAERYTALLEQAVRENPHQWYHFGPFFSERIQVPKHEKANRNPCWRPFFCAPPAGAGGVKDSSPA